ncbi:S8 family serine peptidase [Salipiger mucosus]|uniref:Alkaline phosphatase n=1 Tax=Salipiger mucosus DSM 16094 TaxID=1123237 RepID=S9SCI7_9RHOB|nr:S8 family serine peptidase [Salipiger mucosus]EPX83959.1 Alkaline phosphatase [Salipiger mucosus DSM 16094]
MNTTFDTHGNDTARPDAPAFAEDEPNHGASWHLYDAPGVNIEGAWEHYSGEGVLISFMDNGFKYDAPELSGNYRADLSFDHAEDDGDIYPGSGEFWHGTMVSQVAVGGDNEIGGIGISYNAEWSGQRVDFAANEGLEEAFAEGAMNADVFNNSWSFLDAYGGSYQSPYYETRYGDVVDDATQQGRDGLGTVIVISAGNDGSPDGANAPTHSLKVDPGTIVVGNYDATDEINASSGRGANLLVSAPGTGLPVQDGDQTKYGTGTSISAPVVSGVSALMLEANEDLGWRDVQDIIALSARYIDSDHDSWETNGAGNWNGGGMTFSNDYGFGAIDATAATSLARNWLDVGTTASQRSASGSFAPGGAQTGSQFTVDVSDDIDIQHTLIEMSWESTSWEDVVLKLTSPNGTESVIVEGRSYGSDSMVFEFGSNAFWSEGSAGTWTVDVVHQDTGDPLDVEVSNIEMTFLGDETSQNDQYFFTEDFAAMVAEDASRGTLNDASGLKDIVNTSASSDNNQIDIRNGAASTISGGELTVEGGIEHIIAGAGNDGLDGNGQANTIFADFGDDTINGNGGGDYIVAARGDDNIYGGSGNDRIVAGYGNDYVHGDSGNDTILGGDGFDQLNGGSGDDLIFGWQGIDSINGGNGGDRIFGGRGNDGISGWDGHDRIWGDSGADHLQGALGNDSLDGGTGNDTLLGQEGNDRLDGGTGQDSMSGGTGNDVYVVDDEGDQVIEQAGEGNDAMYILGSGSFDVGDHVETGRLFDSAGNAELHGGLGDNSIWGNDYDNVLSGGVGSDTLRGGGGADTFEFTDASGETDYIVDFETGIDDIDLDAILADTATDPWESSDIWLTEADGNVEVWMSADAYEGDVSGDVNVAILTGISLSGIQ